MAAGRQPDVGGGGGSTRHDGRAHASIVGGSPAGGGYPFMALVYDESGGPEGGSECSGTLVANNMVLTAAHCVVDQISGEITGPELFKIKLGTPMLYGGGHWYPAETIYVAPGYTPSSEGHNHDVALIELPGPVHEPTIRLDDLNVAPETAVSVLGWGDTAEDPTPEVGGVPTELMIGQTVVQSGSYCRREIGGSFDLSVQLCTIDYPTYLSATCFGDSGGPAVIEQEGTSVEVGIVSHSEILPGEPGCSTHAPRVLTSAAAEAPWVEQVIEEHPAVLPTMTEPEAIHDVFNVLQKGPYRHHFNGHYQYSISCRRVKTTKFRCKPDWGARGLDYVGAVTIYSSWEEGVAVWSYHYRLSWINDRCYTDPGHPALCHEHRSTG
jgi:secreted trypsin-like serine protease